MPPPRCLPSFRSVPTMWETCVTAGPKHPMELCIVTGWDREWKFYRLLLLCSRVILFNISFLIHVMCSSRLRYIRITPSTMCCLDLLICSYLGTNKWTPGIQRFLTAAILICYCQNKSTNESWWNFLLHLCFSHYSCLLWNSCIRIE